MSPSPPALNLSWHQGLSNESALRITWPKYWSFSFSPSNEHSGLISFSITSLISLQSKGLSRVFSNTTVQKHQFFGAQPSLWSNFHIFMVQLSHPYMTTGKTIALTRQTFDTTVDTIGTADFTCSMISSLLFRTMPMVE